MTENVSLPGGAHRCEPAPPVRPHRWWLLDHMRAIMRRGTVTEAERIALERRLREARDSTRHYF
jgi:hypothetical protein